VAGVLAGLSDRHIRVGDRAGLAQAMKLANNFLSATALAARWDAFATAEPGADFTRIYPFVTEH
jgi:3-hydroxyisobutyrate dehydrogenase